MNVKKSGSTALTWHKSTYSDNEGGQCIEVAASCSGTVHVRDSKDRQGPRLDFSPEAWADFVEFAAAF